MHREHEYRHLADNARKRGGEEQNVQLADQSKKIDDTANYDPLDRSRTVWP